jgi:hypothetical protein
MSGGAEEDHALHRLGEGGHDGGQDRPILLVSRRKGRVVELLRGSGIVCRLGVDDGVRWA